MELGVLDAVNSAVVCVIGIRTAQFGFVPANLLCIGPYAGNLFRWRINRRSVSSQSGADRNFRS